jgi:hypothetical protein
MHLIVKAGSIISSIEYNKAKDGNAITTKIRDGITVQIISIAVPWTTPEAEPASIESLLKYQTVLTITTKTKKNKNVIKNIKS